MRLSIFISLAALLLGVIASWVFAERIEAVGARLLGGAGAKSAGAVEAPARISWDDPPGTVELRTPQSAGFADNEALSRITGGKSNNFQLVRNYPEGSPVRQLAKGVGRLDIRPKGKPMHPCTASLISERHVLTAGHCFYPMEGATKPFEIADPKTDLVLVLGFLGRTRNLLGVAQPNDVVAELSFDWGHDEQEIVYEEDGLDYAVLVLKEGEYQRALDAGYGKIDIGDVKIGNLHELMTVHHPYNERLILTQRYCQARVQEGAEDKSRFLHQCDTLPGSSGAPVFSTHHQVAAAIHVEGFRVYGQSGARDAQPQYNTAVKIAAIAERSHVVRRLMIKDPLTAEQNTVVGHARERTQEAKRARLSGQDIDALYLLHDGLEAIISRLDQGSLLNRLHESIGGLFEVMTLRRQAAQVLLSSESFPALGFRGDRAVVAYSDGNDIHIFSSLINSQEPDEVVFSQEGHPRLFLSRDGAHLFVERSTSDGFAVDVRDSKTGGLQKSFTVPGEMIAVSNDGKKLLVQIQNEDSPLGSADGAIILFDVEKQKEISRLSIPSLIDSTQGNYGIFSGATFDSANRTVLIALDNSALFWNLQTGGVSKFSEIDRAAASHDSQWRAVATYDGRVKLFSAGREQPNCVHATMGHLVGLTFGASPDHLLVLEVMPRHEDGLETPIQLAVLDSKDCTVASSVQSSVTDVRMLVSYPDSIVVEDDDRKARIFSLSAGNRITETQSRNYAGQTTAIAFNEDRNAFLTLEAANDYFAGLVVRLWNEAPAGLIDRFRIESRPLSHPDGGVVDLQWTADAEQISATTLNGVTYGRLLRGARQSFRGTSGDLIRLAANLPAVQLDQGIAVFLTAEGAAVARDTNTNEIITSIKAQSGARFCGIGGVVNRKLIVFGGCDGHLILHELGSGKQRSVRVSSDPLEVVQVGKGEFIAVLQRRLLSIYSFDLRKILDLNVEQLGTPVGLELGSPLGLVVHPRGSQVLVLAANNRDRRPVALMIDLEARKLITRIVGLSDFPFFAAPIYSDDGELAAFGHKDGTIQIYESASGTQVARLVQGGGSVTSLSFDTDGMWLAAGRRDGRIQLWSLRDFSLASDIPAASLGLRGVSSVRFSPDGRFLAMGDTGTTIAIIRAPTEPVQMIRQAVSAMGRMPIPRDRCVSLLSESACTP